MNAEALVKLVEGDNAAPVVPSAITLSLQPTPTNSAKNNSVDLVNKISSTSSSTANTPINTASSSSRK